MLSTYFMSECKEAAVRGTELETEQFENELKCSIHILFTMKSPKILTLQEYW